MPQLGAERQQGVFARHLERYQSDGLQIRLILAQIDDGQTGAGVLLLFDHLDHGIDVERFVQHAIDAAPKRFGDVPLELTMPRHCHGGGVRRDLADLAEGLYAVHARHHDVDHDQVEMVAPHELQARLPILCGGDAVALDLQDIGQSLTHGGVVIDDEYPDVFLFSLFHHCLSMALLGPHPQCMYAARRFAHELPVACLSSGPTCRSSRISLIKRKSSAGSIGLVRNARAPCWRA